MGAGSSSHWWHFLLTQGIMFSIRNALLCARHTKRRSGDGLADGSQVLCNGRCHCRMVRQEARCCLGHGRFRLIRGRHILAKHHQRLVPPYPSRMGLPGNGLDMPAFSTSFVRLHQREERSSRSRYAWETYRPKLSQSAKSHIPVGFYCVRHV